LLATAALLAGGYLLGRLTAPRGPEAAGADLAVRRQALRAVAEAYQPSCDELSRHGLSRVLEQGDTYLLLQNTEDRFQVIGLDLEPGRPPVTYSWSAGRAYALEACR
jgi:hypothetical protein